MKRKALLTLLLLSCIGQFAFAKDGYHIQLKFTNTLGADDSIAFLAHYYAKGMPTIYKTDSARIKNGTATFNSKEFTLGGIYIIMLSDHKTYFEFLLNNGDDMAITANAQASPVSLAFKNSKENDGFQEYTNFIKTYGEKQRSLMSEYNTAKTAKDSAKAREALAASSKDLTTYRRNYIKTHPGTLLSSIFNALEIPEIPEGKHYLEDGKTVDSTFAYTYYKSHYWDHFNFQDDRLINTPIYDSRLEEYITKETYPAPDSIEYEADMLLKKTRGTKELFKYTLSWFANFAETSKIMGMDEVFVYLVENYYMKGDATWLDNEALNKYIDRAMKIAPNVIGNVAPEVKMIDIDKKEHKLSDVKAKYTILVFWSADCGHCQHEIPLLDSVYNAELKQKGTKVFAVRTEGDETKWQEFIKKNNLTDWINVYDPERKSDFVSKYDVYSTPVIYVLDEKKIIRGKRLDHTTVPEVINMLERKEKKSKS